MRAMPDTRVKIYAVEDAIVNFYVGSAIYVELSRMTVSCDTTPITHPAFIVFVIENVYRENMQGSEGRFPLSADEIQNFKRQVE